MKEKIVKAFLSHSSAQNDFIHEVVRWLGNDSCIVDEFTFENAHKTMNEIAKAFEGTSIFVFFISKESLDSSWVNDEISNIRDYVDEGKVKFLPFIIDSEIDHSNTKVKQWIRHDYNLQYYHSPRLVARKIKEEIRNIVWDNYPDLREQQMSFIGRDAELSELTHKYYEVDGGRRCMIVAGFPPGIGRKRLIAEFVRQKLLTNKDETYSPIVIRLEKDDSIENLIIQLNDIAFELSNNELLDIGQMTKTEKVELAVKLFLAIDKEKESVIIDDGGCCVLTNGKLSSWFREIVVNKGLPNKLCLFVAATSYVSYLVEQDYKEVFFLNINPLKKQEIIVLFKGYARLLGVSDINQKLGNLTKLPCLPSNILRSTRIIKEEIDPKKIVRSIEAIVTSEADNYVPILKELKNNDEISYQSLLILSKFDFISFDIIIKILQKVVNSDYVYSTLEKLYTMAMYEKVGSNSQYIRLNPIVADYISRNKMVPTGRFKQAMDTVLRNSIVSFKISDDLSGFIYKIQQAIRNNVKGINRKYLIPSFTLKVIIEEYNSKNFDNVIILADKFLVDNHNAFKEIMRSIHYWECMALCRKRDRRALDEINGFKGYTYYFLLGFYHRCEKRYLQALGYYKNALEMAYDNKNKDYVAKARHELVVVSLKLGDYEGALDEAKKNYEVQPANRYHIEAYFRCLIKTGHWDSVLLTKLLEEYGSLINSKFSNIIYTTLQIEYDFYINHKQDFIIALRKLIADSPEEYKHYPYQALKEMTTSIKAEQTISDLPEKYGEALNDSDSED